MGLPQGSDLFAIKAGATQGVAGTGTLYSVTWDEIVEAMSATLGIEDIYTSNEVDVLLGFKANISEVYTQSETNSAIANAISTYDGSLGSAAYQDISYFATAAQGVLAAAALPAASFTKTNVDALGINATHLNAQLPAYYLDWANLTDTPSDVTNITSLLAAKAPLADPAFTGNPTAPTQAPGNNTTRLATTAFVTAAVVAAGGYGTTEFNADLATKDTDDLAEGSTNLYYTDTRVNSAIDTRVDQGFVEALSIAVPWSNISGAPTEFTPGTHTHSMSEVTGLVSALAAKIETSTLGAAGGVATLDGSGLVPSSQLPSFVDDVLEYANVAAFPGTGEASKIYVALDTSRTWRWSGSAYTEILASPGTTDNVTEGSGNLYYTAARVNSAIDTRVDKTFIDALNVDADTFDGYDSSAFGRLAADQPWSGVNTFNGALVVSSDSGTPSGKVKFGRSTVQYVDVHGSASGNFITSVSDVGNPKTKLYLGVSTDSGATHAATWIFDSADSSLKSGANTFWHSGTFNPTDYAALASANVFTTTQYISMASSLPFRLTRTGSTGGVGVRYTNDAGYVDVFGIPTGSGTGQFAMPDGTVSLPGMVFTNDTNTGVYRYTTDQVGIAAGGSTSAIFSNSTVTLPGVTTGDRKLWIGQGRSGNGYSYIDLVGDATYTSYGLRIIRGNSGANTDSYLQHRGTGALYLQATDAGTIKASIAGTERVRINGADTQTLELQGQINLTTSVGTLRSKIDWGITQTGLTISNEDNTPIYFRTTAVNRMSISDIGQVNIGTTTAHSGALLRVRRSGDGIEWGHATAAYHNTLGAEAGSGAGTLIFQGMTGTTSNTYKTTGVKASIMKGNNAGGFLWGTVASTNADSQAFSQTMSLNSSGHLTATRIALGYDAATDNSIGCSNWFRSSGNSGWFNGTHGGGVYMIDTTWVRLYNSKSLYVANQIAATGNITAAYSDMRLKTKVGPLTDALAKVRSLNGFIYTENETARELGYTNDKPQVGLSAQEVEAVLPYVVSLAPVDMATSKRTGKITSKSGKNYLTVDYAKLVPLLVEAIKEMIDKIEWLEEALNGFTS